MSFHQFREDLEKFVRVLLPPSTPLSFNSPSWSLCTPYLFLISFFFLFLLPFLIFLLFSTNAFSISYAGQRLTAGSARGGRSGTALGGAGGWRPVNRRDIARRGWRDLSCRRVRCEFL
jgi:peptidoglycan/LPS O-acetylase OafA/YrhL